MMARVMSESAWLGKADREALKFFSQAVSILFRKHWSAFAGVCYKLSYIGIHTIVLVYPDGYRPACTRVDIVG